MKMFDSKPPEPKRARVEQPAEDDDDDCFFGTQSDEFWKALDQSVLDHMKKPTTVVNGRLAAEKAGAPSSSTVVRVDDRSGVVGACLRLDGLSRFESTQREEAPALVSAPTAAQLEQLEANNKRIKEEMGRRDAELNILRYQCTQLGREKDGLRTQLEVQRADVDKLRSDHCQQLDRLKEKHQDEMRFTEMNNEIAKFKKASDGRQSQNPPSTSRQPSVKVCSTPSSSGRRPSTVRPSFGDKRSTAGPSDETFVDRRSFYSLNLSVAGNDQLNQAEEIQATSVPPTTPTAAAKVSEEVQTEPMSVDDDDDDGRFSRRPTKTTDERDWQIRRHLRHAEALSYLSARVERSADAVAACFRPNLAILDGITVEKAVKIVNSKKMS